MSAVTDRLTAELTLIELGVLRDRNRRRAGALRFTSRALGVLHVATAGWVLLAGRHRVVVVYAPALLVIAVLTALRQRRAARVDGVQAPVTPWLAAAGAALVVAPALSLLGRSLDLPLLEEVGPTLAFALAYHLLGWWGRNRALILATAAMPVVSLLAATVTGGDALVAAQFAGSGVLLLLAGLAPDRSHP